MKLVSVALLAAGGLFYSCSNDVSESSDLNIIPAEERESYEREQKFLFDLKEPLAKILKENQKTKEIVEDLISQGYELSQVSFNYYEPMNENRSLPLVPIDPVYYNEDEGRADAYFNPSPENYDHSTFDNDPEAEKLLGDSRFDSDEEKPEIGPHKSDRKTLVVEFYKSSLLEHSQPESEFAPVPVNQGYDVIPIKIEFDQAIDEVSDLEKAEILKATKLKGFTPIPV